MRPWRLKLCTRVDSGQMYYVYQNQAAAYLSLYFFIFLSLQFSNLEIFRHFSRKLWGLEDWKLVLTWTVGRCIMYTRIRLLLLIHPFISSFFFLSNFQHWNFSSHFSLELWGPSYSSLNFFTFSFRQYSNIKNLVTLFSGTVRPRRLKLVAQLESGCCCIFIPFFHFSFPIFKH